MAFAKKFYVVTLALSFLLAIPSAQATYTSVEGLFRYQAGESLFAGTLVTDGKVLLSDARVGIRIRKGNPVDQDAWTWEYYRPDGTLAYKIGQVFFQEFNGQTFCYVFITAYPTPLCGSYLLVTDVTSIASFGIQCQVPGNWRAVLKFTPGGSTVAQTLFDQPFTLASAGPKAKLRPLGPDPQKPSVLTNGPTQISTQSYEISVQDECGNISPNADVTMDFQPVAKSGGHDHDDPSRPKGKFDLNLAAPGINTGRSGILTVKYTAPEVSGKTKLTLDCKLPDGTACIQNEEFIEVAVTPRLVPLGAGGSYDLVGIGGTPGVSSQHNDNHWVTSSFATKLKLLAEMYFGKYGTESSPKLQYNDMSLESGGLFDVFNDWKPDHHEHRIGISGDMRLVPFERQEKLRDFLGKSGIVGRLKVHPNHWHIREYGNNQ